MCSSFVRDRDIWPLKKEVARLQAEVKKTPEDKGLQKDLDKAKMLLRQMESQNKKYNSMFA